MEMYDINIARSRHNYKSLMKLKLTFKYQVTCGYISETHTQVCVFGFVGDIVS